MNGKTKSLKTSTSSPAVSVIPIGDEDIIEEQRGVSLVVRGDNEFYRVYYGDLIIGSNNLRGSLSKEELSKIVPSGIGLLAVTFTATRVIIVPHRDLYIDGLYICAHSSVGIEPDNVHVLDIGKLHLTLEMKL